MTYRPPEGRPPSTPPWTTPEQRMTEIRQLMSEKAEPAQGPLKDSSTLAKLKTDLEEALEKQVRQPPSKTQLMLAKANRKRVARKECEKLNAKEVGGTWMLGSDFAKVVGLRSVTGVGVKADTHRWQKKYITAFKMLMIRVPDDYDMKKYARYKHKPITRPAPIIPPAPRIEAAIADGYPRLILPPRSPPSWWRRFLLWCLR